MLNRYAIDAVGTLVRRGVARAWRSVLRWAELGAQRRALLALDDRMLKDIGITRADALEAARRPFWEDPLTRERRSPGAEHYSAGAEAPARQVSPGAEKSKNRGQSKVFTNI